MSKEIVIVSSGYDMCIRFWADFRESQCRYQIEYKDSAINALEMTPNKDYVAFAAANSIKFIDLHTLNPTPVTSIESHEGLVSTILIPQNFDNCFISAGEDCSVRINDIRAGKGIRVFYHSNYVNTVAIANNNKDLICADENGHIKIWDLTKGDVRCEYNSNVNEEGLAFRSIALAEDEGFLIGAKSNGTCCIFDYNANKDIEYLSSFEAHKNYITKCVLSPEHNLLATCSADTEIRLWEKVDKDKKEFCLKNKLIGHKKWVWDCDFSLDSNYLISCSSDKTIKIWSLETGKFISNFPNPKGVNHIALADDESE
jgi:G protein beta subunit-like protein